MYKKMWGEGVVGVVNPICAVQEGTYGIRPPTAPLPTQNSFPGIADHWQAFFAPLSV